MADCTHRLNNNDRHLIINNLREKLFEAEFAALEKRGKELSERIYRCIVPVEVEKAIKKIPGWKDFVHVQDEVRTELTCPKTNAHQYFQIFGRDFPVKIDHRYGASAVMVTVELYREAVEYAAEREALKKKREDLLTQVRAQIYSARTVGTLLRRWPEGKVIIPEHMQGIAPRNLPVPVTAELNKSLLEAGIKFEEPQKLAA